MKTWFYIKDEMIIKCVEGKDMDGCVSRLETPLCTYDDFLEAKSYLDEKRGG